MNADIDIMKLRHLKKATEAAIDRAELLLNGISVSHMTDGGVAIDYEVQGLCLTVEINSEGKIRSVRQ